MVTAEESSVEETDKAVDFLLDNFVVTVVLIETVLLVTEEFPVLLLSECLSDLVVTVVVGVFFEADEVLLVTAADAMEGKRLGVTFMLEL